MKTPKCRHRHCHSKSYPRGNLGQCLCVPTSVSCTGLHFRSYSEDIFANRHHHRYCKKSIPVRMFEAQWYPLALVLCTELDFQSLRSILWKKFGSHKSLCSSKLKHRKQCHSDNWPDNATNINCQLELRGSDRTFVLSFHLRTLFRRAWTKKSKDLRPLIRMLSGFGNFGIQVQSKIAFFLLKGLLNLGGAHQRQTIQEITATENTEFLKFVKCHFQAF